MKETTMKNSINLVAVLAIFLMSLASEAKDKSAASDKVPLPGAISAPAPVPTKGSGAEAAPVTPGSERVDISDIENKYWAPKDTDFSVVQNRTYVKEKKLSFTFQYGPAVNEQFNKGNNTALGLNYFFSERHGLQFDYVVSGYKNSNITNEFQAQGGSPDYGRVTGYYGIGYNFVPFYAKMSVLGSRIIYFDMAFTPTVGFMQYEQLTLDAGTHDKSAMSFGFDITQWFFIHKNFAVRVDIKNHYYKEEILKYQTDGSVTSGTKLRNKNSDNTQFLIGGTFFF